MTFLIVLGVVVTLFVAYAVIMLSKIYDATKETLTKHDLQMHSKSFAPLLPSQAMILGELADIKSQIQEIKESYHEADNDMNEALTGVEKYLNELRADMIYSQRYNEVALENIYFYANYSYHLIGFNLEPHYDREQISEKFKVLSPLFDASNREDKKHASLCAQDARKGFMKGDEETEE